MQFVSVDQASLTSGITRLPQMNLSTEVFVCGLNYFCHDELGLDSGCDGSVVLVYQMIVDSRR